MRKLSLLFALFGVAASAPGSPAAVGPVNAPDPDFADRDALIAYLTGIGAASDFDPITNEVTLRFRIVDANDGVTVRPDSKITQPGMPSYTIPANGIIAHRFHTDRPFKVKSTGGDAKKDWITNKKLYIDDITRLFDADGGLGDPVFVVASKRDFTLVAESVAEQRREGKKNLLRWRWAYTRNIPTSVSPQNKRSERICGPYRERERACWQRTIKNDWIVTMPEDVAINSDDGKLIQQVFNDAENGILAAARTMGLANRSTFRVAQQLQNTEFRPFDPDDAPREGVVRFYAGEGNLQTPFPPNTSGGPNSDFKTGTSIMYAFEHFGRVPEEAAETLAHEFIHYVVSPSHAIQDSQGIMGGKEADIYDRAAAHMSWRIQQGSKWNEGRIPERLQRARSRQIGTVAGERTRQ